MNTLTRHIEVLLLENDCVIVPGLGGFIATMKPAHYVLSEQCIIPPTRVVTFNQNLKDNDGLLAQLYMHSFDATYPQAMMQLEKDIDSLIVALDTTCDVRMGSLGNLTKNLDGRISLSVSENDQIPSPELYSLVACGITPIQEVEENDNADRGRQKDEEEEISEVKSTENRKTDYDEETKKKNHHLQLVDFSIAAAVAAILLLVFAIPGLNTHSGQEETYIAGTPISHSRQNVATAAKPAVRVATKPEAKQEVSSSDVSVRDTFTIVLACNVTEINAKTFIQNLEKRGIMGACFTPGKTTRIVYGSFDDENSAIDSLRSLRLKDAVFADAWILKPSYR